MAVSPTEKMQRIHLNIHKLLQWCKSSINCTDQYYIKQWTDLMKIKTILTDEFNRMEYNKVHAAAMVSKNNDLYVKFLYFIVHNKFSIINYDQTEILAMFQ